MGYRSEALVREAVRMRDGYCCRDCGMTQDEHQLRGWGRLHVHRIQPGGCYTAANCLTLCRWCHSRRPEHSPKVPRPEWDWGPPPPDLDAEAAELGMTVEELEALDPYPLCEPQARLRQLREERGLSQYQLADLLGLSNTSIYAYEAGRQRMRPGTARRLARALGVKVRELTEGRWPRGPGGQLLLPWGELAGREAKGKGGK